MTEGFKSPYALMTEKVLFHLESGVVPWTGQGQMTTIQPPVNFATKIRFRGINAAMTMISTIENGFGTPAFATFNQIRGKRVQGKVAKGAKASHVYYSSTYERDPRAGEGNRINEAGKVESMFLKGFAVFNVGQVEIEMDLKLGDFQFAEDAGSFNEQIAAGKRDHLAAELAMAMVSWRGGTAATLRHHQKVGAWVDAMRKDDRAFYRAATKAQRICDKLFGKDADDPGDEESEGIRAA